jgi:hypothetical protein
LPASLNFLLISKELKQQIEQPNNPLGRHLSLKFYGSMTFQRNETIFIHYLENLLILNCWMDTTQTQGINCQIQNCFQKLRNIKNLFTDIIVYFGQKKKIFQGNSNIKNDN